MSAAYVTIEQLAYERGETTILHDVNVTVRAGELCHIVGGNGSGKSTLLRLLAGILSPTQGAIRYSADLRFPQDVLYIGHQPGIKAALTPRENLRILQRLSSTVTEIDIDTVLAQMGLQAQADNVTQYLSAGQQRRVALSRLALQTNRVWLLDEPFTSLDKGMQAQLMTWIKAHLSAQGIVILTSHNALSWSNIAVNTLALEGEYVE